MSPTIATILCVDDEPNVLRSLERLLRGRNVRVLTADGGAMAIDLLEREAVDVLVSDMRMPGMDGAELLAIAPNQVWSWDISKLKGPVKWTCFHLYVILDIFSRHVVGWLIADR